MGRYKEEDRSMDIKDQVTKAVDKIMKDKVSGAVDSLKGFLKK